VLLLYFVHRTRVLQRIAAVWYCACLDLQELAQLFASSLHRGALSEMWLEFQWLMLAVGGGQGQGPLDLLGSSMRSPYCLQW
jgi:hypothetical protein